MQIADCFRSAIQSVAISKSKDELNQRVLTACFKANFLLLGQLPNHTKKRRSNWRGEVELNEYRTLFYLRSDTQRVSEMIHYEYTQLHPDKKDSCFSRLIEQRRKHPKNDHAVLQWIRQNEPKLFAQFNKA